MLSAPAAVRRVMLSKRVAVTLVVLVATVAAVFVGLSAAQQSDGGEIIPPERQKKDLAVVDDSHNFQEKKNAFYFRGSSSPTTAPTTHPNDPPAPLFDIDDYRLCRINPAPQEGQAPVLMKGLAMQLEYQCAGSIYETFASDLEHVIRDQVELPQSTNTNTSRRTKSSLWGRRNSILPIPTAKNRFTGSTNTTRNVISGEHHQSEEAPERAILIMGNSHTRQIISNVLCQYKDQIQKRTVLYSEDEYDDSKIPVEKQITSNIALVVEFPHNLKLYIVVNCPFVYSHSWHKVLGDVLERPLQSFDAIVVGRFNNHGASRGTTFEAKMKEMEENHPEWNLDFAHVNGPTVKEVAAKYDGPIVWMGMFALKDQKYHRSAVKQIEAVKQNQTTAQHQHLYAINTRQYIEIMKANLPVNATPPIVDECAVDVRKEVTTCNTNTTDKRYTDGHRCMGHRGGHPDLISWDLIDVLHQEFS